MLRLVAVAASWLACGSGASAQNCVIKSGTNDSAITQNCEANPRTNPLSIVSKGFENSSEENGTWRHRLFVQIGRPINLFLAACGDGVVDVGGAPWPSGVAAFSGRITRENCVGHRAFKVEPGRWTFWVITAAHDSQFTLHPVIQQLP